MVRSVFIKAMGKVKTAQDRQEKAQETKAYAARLPEMQTYVGLSEEKRSLLLKVIKANDNAILKKGVIVYARMLEVADKLVEDITNEGIECALINSKVSTINRKKVAEWFKEAPNNKVVVITEAGAESVSLNGTNEIILYDCPNGSGKYSQTIGRVCRNFGNYNEFNIHFIVVEETIDEYKQVLLSSKKELEMELLHADTIQVKQTTSFDQKLLKKIRARMLWKLGKTKRKPKGLELE